MLKCSFCFISILKGSLAWTSTTRFRLESVVFSRSDDELVDLWRW